MNSPALVRGSLIVLALCSTRINAADGDTSEPPGADPFTVVVDDASGKTTITLPARDGRIPCPEIARALARAGRLDDSALDLLPPGHIDLTETRAWLAVNALNLALPSEIHVKIRRSQGNAEPALVVTIDEPGLKQRSRDIRRHIRERAGVDNDDRYGLTLDPGWGSLPVELPVVVLIHGYNSNAASLGQLHAALNDRGFPCAVFAYPNDGPLEESALLLANELQTFRESSPNRAVAIVAHSMGGLVARAVIEDPQLDPGNVRRLIMVATPNHGSQLACFPGGPDCADAFARHRNGGLDALFKSSVADGLNEACEDMQPDSSFLRSLNASERNPAVRYSLLIGTGGPLTEKSLTEIRAAVRSAVKRDRIARLLGPRIEAPLSDFDEVLRDKGDGAVAVKRAHLAGVDDTVLLPFSHLTITRKTTEPQAQTLLNAILNRLAPVE